MTLVLAPARTTVAEAVLARRAEKLRAIEAFGTRRAIRARRCGRASRRTSGWISAGVDGEARAAEGGEGFAEARDGAVGAGHRAVAGLAGMTTMVRGHE